MNKEGGGVAAPDLQLGVFEYHNNRGRRGSRLAGQAASPVVQGVNGYLHGVGGVPADHNITYNPLFRTPLK